MRNENFCFSICQISVFSCCYITAFYKEAYEESGYFAAIFSATLFQFTVNDLKAGSLILNPGMRKENTV